MVPDTPVDEEEDPTETGFGIELSFFVDREAVVAVIHEICGEKWKATFDQKFEWLVATLGKYQEQPTLLNPHLSEMLTPMTESMIKIATDVAADRSLASNIPQFHAICKVVQLCCRVRGYKHVMKTFPHEVSHLELCLILLRAQVREISYNFTETGVVHMRLILIIHDVCESHSTESTGEIE